jgi:pimeloyl-ACP methyl ester carboxylesterase
LFAAAAHPDRIASLIVGEGGAAVPIQLGEPLNSWVLDPDLDRYRRMDPRAIVDTAIDTIAGGVRDDIRADYLACYAGDRFFESMRYVRQYPKELPELAELLPQITTPVTIINGRHDHVVPVTNAEFLDERLPNSRVILIDAGHFVWEESPAEYASTILDSMTGAVSCRCASSPLPRTVEDHMQKEFTKTESVETGGSLTRVTPQSRDSQLHRSSERLSDLCRASTTTW